MKTSAPQNDGALKDIERRFSRFRHEHQGERLRYPKPLQELAVAALEQGHTWIEVSRAAGVTSRCLRYWRNLTKTKNRLTRKTRPLELKLVESRGAQSIATTATHDEPITNHAEVRVELRSGVRMTLPVSALSERLINLLQGAVS